MAEGLWNLYDQVTELDSASRSWSDLVTALTDAGDTVDTKSRSVRDAGWEGQTADSWDTHRKKLVGDLDAASTVAGSMASALSLAAGSVRIAQGRLDLEWAKIAGIPYQGSPSGDLRFETETEAESQRVTASIQAAQTIREGLDRTLAQDVKSLDQARRKWQRIAATWLTVANGAKDGFDVPTEGTEPGVITVGDQTIVNTGSGDDTVKVFIDPHTGEQIVEVNGQVYRVPAGQDITIRSGGGSDTVEVPAGTDLDLTVVAGEGDDLVRGGDGDDDVLGLDGRDKVYGGAGDDRTSGGADRDYLDGQSGNDTITGGLGDDTVYGLDGNDTTVGGEGQDYLEGGTGEDTVVGGADDDILSGGRDDDTLLGGSGADVSYAGTGTDTTYGGTGDDTTHSEAGDTDTDVENHVTVEIPDDTSWIQVEGSPEFVARVRADLDLLASSPRGQMMLDNLKANHDDSGFLGLGKEGVTIKEYFEDNNLADPNGNVISYNPGRDESVDDRPPIVGLYHEMAHIYDFMNDTSASGTYDGVDDTDEGINNSERQAAGLPIDDDEDDSTPERIDPRHPWEYTENALRQELGWDPREHYRG